MKKVLLTLSAVALASSVFAQGTITFNNRVANTTISHVYAGGTTQVSGNGPTDFVAGSFDWSGYTLLAGSGYSAALLSGPAGATESALVFQTGSVTTFRTGAGAGWITPLTVTLSNVAGDAPTAVFQMVAWSNLGGTITTWADALQAAASNPAVLVGKSQVFTVSGIGGTVNLPPNLVGLQSFNIYSVPEPSTFALAGLGAAALMIFRRRK